MRENSEGLSPGTIHLSGLIGSTAIDLYLVHSPTKRVVVRASRDGLIKEPPRAPSKQELRGLASALRSAGGEWGRIAEEL